MPSRRHHLEDDEWLRENSIICQDTDGNSVHARLDYHSRNYRSQHRELDRWHDPEAIRDWIDNIYNSVGISPERATDCVRIAYMHLALDEACDRFFDEHGRKPQTDDEWNAVHTRAHQMLSGRRHDTARYSPRRP